MSYELVGSSGVVLTSCGRHISEVSSARCMPSEHKDGIVNSETQHFSKSYSKLWKFFIQWLKHKITNTIKDFKIECEWK